MTGAGFYLKRGRKYVLWHFDYAEWKILQPQILTKDGCIVIFIKIIRNQEFYLANFWWFIGNGWYYLKVKSKLNKLLWLLIMI